MLMGAAIFVWCAYSLFVPNQHFHFGVANLPGLLSGPFRDMKEASKRRAHSAAFTPSPLRRKPATAVGLGRGAGVATVLLRCWSSVGPVLLPC